MAIRAVRYAWMIKRLINQGRVSLAVRILTLKIYTSHSPRPLYAPLFTLFCVNKIANLFDANHYM